MSHLKDRERERKLEKIRGRARNGTANGNGGGGAKPKAAKGAISFDRREADRLADDLADVSVRLERALSALTRANIAGRGASPRELLDQLDGAAERTHDVLMRVNRKRGFA